MSLTVVVTRDYDDVPSCFEKYELGTRWRVNGGNLEVFVGTTLAALYPSGNWVSVFADDAMQLFKGGALPDYSTMPRVDRPSRPTVSSDGPADGDAAVVSTGATGPLPADDVSEHHISRSRPSGVVEDPMYGPGGLHEQYGSRPGGGSSPDIIAGEDVAAARAAMLPVSFRPRTYRTATPAKKSPVGPRLLPIKLRMKRFRQATASDAPAESAAPRMMPVQLRTTTYRAARTQPDDGAAQSGAPEHDPQHAPRPDAPPSDDATG